jgi:hypothetical protein
MHITAVDNELIVTALNAAGVGSSEVVHLKSGFGAPVNYQVNLAHILPTGKYNLLFVGINWGGPSAFKATLLQGTTVVNVPVPTTWPTTVGVVWSQVMSIDV